MTYDPQRIERRWQSYWEEHATYRTPNPDDAGFDAAKPKYYVLAMFPYPSGAGMHMGHALNYTTTDIAARYQRMRGCNVLHPIGFDAFGLPAEQYAIETGTHPAQTTQNNIDNISAQLRRLGLSFDWSREISTTDPEYYRWTQWIFLQLYHSYFDPIENRARPLSHLMDMLQNEQYYVTFDGELQAGGIDETLAGIAGDPVGVRKWHELSGEEQHRLIEGHRLAYLDEVPVNWCPQLGTVLANEEVTADGRSERGNFPVVRRPLKQWMLRITSYADRLLADLDLVDWPEPIRLMQRNWIGRSTGADVDFAVQERDEGGKPGDGATKRRSDGEYEPEAVITVFTTRPETLFGATYMVLAPEHPLVAEITTAEQLHAVTEYQRDAAARSDLDRQADNRAKTGVFTGAYATNPVTAQPIPIWIADYVLMGYGTGAIMAVPAHDDRDHAFARAFDLPIVPVIRPPHDHEFSESAYTGDGEETNSSNDTLSLDGLDVADAKRRIIDWLDERHLGRETTQYKLRDWLFSRQRYWGEPFPILHEVDPDASPAADDFIDDTVRAVDEGELPVRLPEMRDFKPTASEDPHGPVQTPLSRAPESWKTLRRDGQEYVRELNTMPQWAGSCWYYLRFLDPENGERFVGREAERYWMGGGRGRGIKGSRDQEENNTAASSHHLPPSASAPRPLDPSTPSPPPGVDLYVGGVEHAVLHLLYARFWHKVLFDLGHVSTAEPFGKLFNQGYIQAWAYTDARGVYVPSDEVRTADGKPAGDVDDKHATPLFYNGEPVTAQFGKMGKSLKNSLAPDEYCDRYGADTLRLFLMYLGPLDQSKLWNPRDIVGVHRFLQRLWRNLVPPTPEGEPEASVPPPPLVAEHAPTRELARKAHATIKRATEAMESLSYNVAIASLIELNNELVELDRVPRWVAEVLVRMLSPLAPHIAEELWWRLGHEASVVDAPWPEWDATMLVADEVELPVQVNGKMRGKITLPAARAGDEDAARAAAVADPRIAAALGDASIRKVILVPGRMLNLIAS